MSAVPVSKQGTVMESWRDRERKRRAMTLAMMTASVIIYLAVDYLSLYVRMAERAGDGTMADDKPCFREQSEVIGRHNGRWSNGQAMVKAH